MILKELLHTLIWHSHHYVTTRIHWLVEELQKEGIEEIMVTEYFRPNSQISKFEFLCKNDDLQDIQNIIHAIGTCDKSADHYLTVKDIDSNAKSIFPFMQNGLKNNKNKIPI